MVDLNDVPPPPKRKQTAKKKAVPKETAAKLRALQRKKLTLKRSKEYVERKEAELKAELAAKQGKSPEEIEEKYVKPFEPPPPPEPRVAFRPNPGPQEAFLAAPEREVLYGGAAGGGKSYAMLADPLRYCHFKDFRGILFRRTNDELRELIFKSKEMYKAAFPDATFSEKKSSWTFPSGAELWFTYLDRDDDVTRYQGQAFAWIGFDELTQWPSPFPWEYMRSRLRTTNPEIPLFMRASTNPGGVGGWWVRKMFIDPAPPGSPFWATDIETGDVLRYPTTHALKPNQPLFKRRFIPARLMDNPYLTYDGQYEANLLAMPESQRRQLLDGDWDIVEGAAFPEFRRDIHVCDPFEIPSNWTCFRACDWGFSSKFGVLWMAVDWENTIYIYREWYGSHLDADAFTDQLLAMEELDRIRYGILDSSVWQKRGDVGMTIAERMNRRGCNWRPSDRSKGSRVAGKLEVHRRLAHNLPDQPPKLKIFANCVNLIRTLPTLPLDKSNPEDVDTKAEDHLYDALRYGLQSRPVNKDVFSDFQRRVLPTYQPVDPTFGY